MRTEPTRISCRVACLTLGVALILSASAARAQLPFFPGAEGFGGTFSTIAEPMQQVPAGGWFANASVYHVTNLNDSGPGSLRNGLIEGMSNRIIVFDVGGTFNLTSDNLELKTVRNVYLAGQTAPSPVTIYGDFFQITHSSGTSNTNVITRYLSFRPNNGADAFSFTGGSLPSDTGRGRNMIVDHVSTSWSNDENLSPTNNNTNITVQYSLITDATGGSHAYGSLIRPRSNSSMTFHHNLYGNDKSRNPRMGTYNNEKLTLDFVNNVIYNWSDRAGYAGGGSDSNGMGGYWTEKVDLNWVGNYAIAGPSTPDGSQSTTALYKDIAGSNGVELEVYQALNIMDSNKNAARDGADTGWGMFGVVNNGIYSALPDADKVNPNYPNPDPGLPFAAPPVTTQAALDAYYQTLAYAGNHLPDVWGPRSGIDARIIGNVQDFTQPGPMPATAPVESERLAVVNAPTVPRPNGIDTNSDGQPDKWPGYDSDGDGMSDVWELAHGLNPNSSADQLLDFDSDGYVNLIEYINELGEFPCPTPIEFMTSGGVDNNYAKIMNWKTNDGGITAGSNWQPSKYDEARIKGTSNVVVNAPGQHAGALIIGSDSGSNATLQITGGWLDVAGKIVGGTPTGVQIGTPSSQGTLQLSGGVLSTPILDKQGAGSSFSFTGGVLHADLVTFDLVNNGGTLAPGHSIGQTYVAGDLQLISGTLEIELASALQSGADTLLIEGSAALGGMLSVATLGGFTPQDGNNWQIMATGDGITDNFASITPGYSVQKQGNNLFLFFGNASANDGDYDDNGVVDDRDIDILWKIVRGTGTDPNNNDTADLNGDSFVNEDDVDTMLASKLTAGPNMRYGDANLSGGTPELTDYNLWRTGTGGWAGGDFDGSGGVPELNDYNLWRTGPTQFPGTVGSHGGGAPLVPEPATLVLLATALPAFALVALRHRSRRARPSEKVHRA